MTKQKFKFDPDQLTYVPHEENKFKRFVIRTLSIFSVSLILAFVVFIVSSSLFMSSRTKRIHAENDQLMLQYEILEKKIELIDSALGNLQERDKNIYKAIFETDTVPFGETSRSKDEQKHINIYFHSRKNNTVIGEMKIELEQQKKKYQQMANLLKRKGDTLQYMPAILPIPDNENVQLAAGYGLCLSPLLKIVKYHEGLDFSAPSGTKVFATANGIVSFVGNQRGYGLKIVIKHSKTKLNTIYAHLAEATVKEGQTIKRGDCIGIIDKTTFSSTPHLHYEVREDSRESLSFDPLDYLFLEVNADKYRKLIEQLNFSNQSMD